MHPVHLASVDLNLLVVLDALLTERHVTRAARRIGKTQSATSHALARLRELLGDALLVRGGSGLVLTPRAEELRTLVGGALASIESALTAGPFEPRESRRTFVVGTVDYGELMVVPPLLSWMSSHAPHMDLVVRPPPEAVVSVLAEGGMDLVIGVDPAPELVSSLHRRRLFRDGFCCLVRRGHPRIGPRGLDLETYLELGHVLIAPRGRRGGVVDEALARRGLERRVAARIPSFSAAPAIVAGTDLIVTMPARIARPLAAAHALQVLAPPLPVSPFAMAAYWHERSNRDAGHQWLREALVAALQTLPGDEPEAPPVLGPERRRSPRVK